MPNLINLADFKLVQNPNEIPIAPEDVPLQSPPFSEIKKQVFTLLASNTQNADAPTGYILFKEALKAAVQTFADGFLNPTPNFVIDVIINERPLEFSENGNFIDLLGNYNFYADCSINVTQVTSLDPNDLKTDQSQLSYFGVQDGTTVPADATGLASNLGMFGARTITGIPAGLTRNIVFAIPSQKESIRRILLQNLTDEFGDYTKTADAFVIGSTSYDVYISNTQKPDTFNGETLTLVP